MNNKKIWYFVSAVFAALIITTVCFSFKSSRWNQKLHENNLLVKELDDGWVYEEKLSDYRNGTIAASRVFSQDEFEQFENKNHQNKIRQVPVLFFVTHNQNVKVFITTSKGKTEYYSSGLTGKKITGTDSGNAVHCIDLPDLPEESFIVTIQFSSSFNSSNQKWNRVVNKIRKNRMPDIYTGTKAACLQYYLYHHIYQYIPILLIFIVCICSLFIFFTFWITEKKKFTSILYWTWFSLELGTGLLLESSIAYLLAKNSFALSYLSTALMAFHPVMLLSYMEKQKLIEKGNTASKVFKIISFVNILFVTAASYVELIPFQFVRIYVIVVLYCSVVYMMCITIQELINVRGTADFMDKVLVLTCACIVVDLAVASFKSGVTSDIFFFTRIGVALFFIAGSFKAIDEMYVNEITAAKVDIVRQTKEMDIITGCINGSVLWQKNLDNSIDNTGLVVFELINVKDICSIYGKTEADNTMRTFARIIKSVFGEDKVYRIMGNKFIALTSYSVTFEDDFKKLAEKDVDKVFEGTKDYKNLAIGAQMIISYSYGMLTPGKDKDLDGLYLRLYANMKRRA